MVMSRGGRRIRAVLVRYSSVQCQPRCVQERPSLTSRPPPPRAPQSSTLGKETRESLGIVLETVVWPRHTRAQVDNAPVFFLVSCTQAQYHWFVNINGLLKCTITVGIIPSYIMSSSVGRPDPSIGLFRNVPAFRTHFLLSLELVGKAKMYCNLTYPLVCYFVMVNIFSYGKQKIHITLQKQQEYLSK